MVIRFFLLILIVFYSDNKAVDDTTFLKNTIYAYFLMQESRQVIKLITDTKGKDNLADQWAILMRHAAGLELCLQEKLVEQSLQKEILIHLKEIYFTFDHSYNLLTLSKL